MAKHSLQQQGIPVDWATETLITVGATEGIAAAFLGLLNAGDEVQREGEGELKLSTGGVEPWRCSRMASFPCLPTSSPYSAFQGLLRDYLSTLPCLGSLWAHFSPQPPRVICLDPLR